MIEITDPDLDLGSISHFSSIERYGVLVIKYELKGFFCF